MNTYKYTMDQLRSLCKTWAQDIGKDFKPDLVVFIAKSGYIIADEFSKSFGVPMDEVVASRSGGNLRKLVAPVFRLLPLKIRNLIVGAKIMYFVNDKKTERNIRVPASLAKLASDGKYKKVLLIDDSIDTGWTFLAAYNAVKEIFRNSEVRSLALIRMDFSMKRFKVDYHYFENALLLTPAQVDSGEYDEFIYQYKKWSENKNKSIAKDDSKI